MNKFQSTPPVWGATDRPDPAAVRRWISIHAPRVGGDGSDYVGCLPAVYFNPRPPCGGRPRECGGDVCGPGISIHAPRVGGDQGQAVFSLQDFISIHAPRVGGDSPKQYKIILDAIFQSTPPVWGATVFMCSLCHSLILFQSTPPVWGATISSLLTVAVWGISIHAPRVGGDQDCVFMRLWAQNFNPRPPCGGRHGRQPER